MNKQGIIEERHGAWWLCTHVEILDMLPSWNRHLSSKARSYYHHYGFSTRDEAFSAARACGIVLENYVLPRLAVRHDPRNGAWGRVSHRYSIISDESLSWSGLTGGKRPWGDRFDGKYVYPFTSHHNALKYAHKVLANYGNKTPVV